MAEVTVEQLAKTVGTDPDKLLSQMKDAGLPHNKAAVSYTHLRAHETREDRLWARRLEKK